MKLAVSFLFVDLFEKTHYWWALRSSPVLRVKFRNCQLCREYGALWDTCKDNPDSPLAFAHLNVSCVQAKPSALHSIQNAAVVFSHCRENRQLRTHAVLPSFLTRWHNDLDKWGDDAAYLFKSWHSCIGGYKKKKRGRSRLTREMQEYRPNVFVSFLFNQRDESFAPQRCEIPLIHTSCLLVTVISYFLTITVGNGGAKGAAGHRGACKQTLGRKGRKTTKGPQAVGRKAKTSRSLGEKTFFLCWPLSLSLQKAWQLSGDTQSAPNSN